MDLRRCDNGHYYDADKYGECPRCGSRGASAPKSTAAARIQPAAAATGVNPAVSAPAVSLPQQPSVQPKKWLTGWLACIEGGLKGNIYELKKGKTTIGGTESQDINLSADGQVAKACQAVIEYDPETRKFSVSAGDSRELSYVNGQVVLFNLELHGRDILQVGEEKLMFIPLCGEDFSWDEEEEN